MRRLIINADDFGLTPGVNRAIAECHQAGMVTSATLMATGAALADAARISREMPRLSVGCHMVLVDGAPVLPPGTVPSLAVGKADGAFPTTLGSFVQRATTGRFRAEEIESEATAQFRKLENAGIAISHFDTHKHTHVFPAVLRPLLRAARASGIRAVRNPFVPARALAFEELRARTQLWKRYLQLRVFRRFLPAFLEEVASCGLVTTDGCLGVMETGFLDAKLFAAMLRAISQELPEGTWEIVCHPGYNDTDLAGVPTRLRESRDQERWVLTSPEAQESLAKSGIQLISYAELSRGL